MKQLKDLDLAWAQIKLLRCNTIEQLIDTIERLNDKNIEVTVDNLGEFVGTEAEANQAKNEILEVMQAVKDYDVDAHMSVKISSLGAEFDLNLAYENLREILLKADEFDKMHINIDTEKYQSLQQIIEVLDRLKGEFKMLVQ